MPHDILQTFQAHASVCHIGAKGVAHDVWSDRRKRFFVGFAVLPSGAAHVVFHTEAYHGIAASVQGQKFGAVAHQTKGEGIFADDVIVMGHPESRLDHASNATNSAVAPAFLLQLHEPELGIRCANRGDQAVVEFFSLQQL